MFKIDKVINIGHQHRRRSIPSTLIIVIALLAFALSAVFLLSNADAGESDALSAGDEFVVNDVKYRVLTLDVGENNTVEIKRHTDVINELHIPVYVDYDGKRFYIVSIGDYAFAHFKLTSVVFAEGSKITSIGKNSFYSCDYLSNFKFSSDSKVTNIGESAFRLTKSISSIIIPSSVTTIGQEAFVNCGGLEISVESGNKNYTSLDGMLFDKNKETLIKGCDRQSVIIPSSVTSIGQSAFLACKNLKYIDIPSSVTSIETAAFALCSSLKYILFRGELPEMGEDTFSLGIIDAPVTVAVSPESFIQKIPIKAYNNATNFITPPQMGDVFNVGGIEYKVLTFGEIGTATVHKYRGGSAVKHLTINTTVSYYGRELDVTSISSYAFFKALNLESVTITEGSKITSIEERAFSACYNLESFKIAPDSKITSIGEGAFATSPKLKNITIPSSVISIKSHAFSDCTSLWIDVDPGNEKYSSHDGMLLDKHKETLFRGRNVNSVTIPSGVTVIEKNAFNGCTSVIDVTIPPSVTSIGTGAFLFCFALKHIKFEGAHIPTLEISSLHLGSTGDRITVTVTPGSFVPQIPRNTYDNNTTFVASSEIEEVFSDGKVKYKVTASKAGNTVEVCGFEVGITRADIGSSVSNANKTYTVTSIGSNAFEECTTLVSVSIPNSVSSIGPRAFSNCQMLSHVDFSKGSVLKTIGPRAFSGCESLSEIVLPAKLATIENRAFEDCAMLRNLTFMGEFAPTFGYKSLSLSSVNPIMATVHAKFTDPHMDAEVLGDFTTVVFNQADPEQPSDNSTALIVGAVAVAGIGVAGAAVWFFRFRKP